MRLPNNARVVRRADNVVLVDFTRGPEPPAPRFPGAGALRDNAGEALETEFIPGHLGRAATA